MTLKKGDSVPKFILKDQLGNTFDSTALLGKKPFVVYFYPRDFTPGCTKEACDFRDSYESFKTLGAEVVGISNDSTARHERFATKYALPFILLADPDGKVRKKFNVKASLLGLLPGRETFVFDKNGKLVMKYNSITATSHTQKALVALKNINYED